MPALAASCCRARHLVLPRSPQVLGNIKVVMLIGLSVAIFHNEVSTTSIVGCSTCLVGVALYNQARRAQPAKEPTLPLRGPAAAPAASR